MVLCVLVWLFFLSSGGGLFTVMNSSLLRERIGYDCRWVIPPAYREDRARRALETNKRNVDDNLKGAWQGR